MGYLVIMLMCLNVLIIIIGRAAIKDVKYGLESLRGYIKNTQASTNCIKDKELIIENYNCGYNWDERIKLLRKYIYENVDEVREDLDDMRLKSKNTKQPIASNQFFCERQANFLPQCEQECDFCLTQAYDLIQSESNVITTDWSMETERKYTYVIGTINGRPYKQSFDHVLTEEEEKKLRNTVERYFNLDSHSRTYLLKN